MAGLPSASQSSLDFLRGLLNPSPAPSLELPPSGVYPEDVVKLPGVNGGSDTYGLVIRCWEDERGPEVAEEAARRGIPFTPLPPGYLEVLHPSGITTQIAESQISVTDRGFLRADLVRATGGKGQAGLITKLETKVELRRVLSNETVEGTFDAADVVAASRIVRGDHVVHGDWVGLVEEVFEMGLVETRSGLPRRVCDSGNALSVGATSENFFLERLPIGPNSDPADLQRILDVKQIVVAVNWLCTNQRGDVTNFDRPKRYWTNLGDLSLVRASADHLHSVGDKVIFRDAVAHPLPSQFAYTATPDGHRVCVITNSQTIAHVLWQDGTTTSGPAPSFMHCVDVDEEVDAFPGDVGVFSGCTPPRVAVVQKMKSKKRTMDIRYYDDEKGEVETVSGLEFDQHGPPPEVYGVRRGDLVLVTKEGQTNGLEIPTVPRLGESEVATGAFPTPEVVRVEISQLGLAYAATIDGTNSFVPKTDAAALAPINWYGEVADLLLDGRILVRFPSGATESFPLDRVYLLDDGLGPEGGMGGEDDMMDEDASQGSWETDDEAGEGEMPGGVSWEDQEADEQDQVMSERRGWAEEDDEEEEAGGEEEVEPVRENGLDVDEIVLEEPKEKQAVAEVAGVSMPAEIEDDEHWSRFLMLEEAPQDHHYASQSPGAPSKAYMARVQKEHKVLSSSLPPNILVRAYEDRADLLRCLIIGPLGTPFANAPFLFDVLLPPTKFPAEPPMVHFHSWCGGTRVSPNLYAEGKVCLSLLNTWHGDKTESWSAARSSILQVFVSIQALIMTENPYYSEPGFEKQQGTLEGEAASDLYNERTLVLTRAFVKRACEYPPKNFEAEVRAYYYTGLPTTGPGALAGIVEQAKQLLVESEQLHGGSMEEDVEEEGSRKRTESKVLPGMLVLTEGASLSLKRTLKGLEPLLTASA